MTDSLLAERHRDPVGENWAKTFVKRRPELKVKSWFQLVESIKAKYSITDEDIYNFDETGFIVGRASQSPCIHFSPASPRTHIASPSLFSIQQRFRPLSSPIFMMGQISTGRVVTAAERRGRSKTVQQGNREWVTVIQGINATGWAIPPFIVFKGKHHLSTWYKEEDLPQDWVIGFLRTAGKTASLG
ncbi:hypothetical protein PtrM4_151850 [Pyrenophora tritici-repentis]|uniref:DDE-1 domain-containing protein n=1 Tax=Pyrenophora tritici-repentis TaxID=45151 RepID=A0A834RNS1_9PLEO|nr:hypothetical protein PtrM4_151850 [Pyrenophora tritici-repentis]